ncbi:MAG: methyltransferase domain-containing protein [Anaerolineae bacterium]|nr:methyltransferase domain-containing protein [Anaerolineae bacterium]
MYRKLQHNFDIIQFLIKDISTEQLNWRKTDGARSLGEIIVHLTHLERLHYHRLQQIGHKLPALEPLATAFGNHPAPMLDCQPTFEAYARCRCRILTLLETLANPPLLTQSPLLEPVNLAEMVAKIDAHDQTYIRQIEAIIQAMPLNPLLSRAISEIDQYHRRYQSHLSQARSLLDIGVGTGLALRHVMRHNPQLSFTGVDIRDLRLPDIRVPLQLYDGETLPFADNRFDVSLLFYVLHHCQKPVRVLEEAVRVTRQKLILIEEFDRPGADQASLDLTERYGHWAIGLPVDLPYQLFDQFDFELMLDNHRLICLDRQILPSKTSRPVQKFLYVTAIAK